MQGKLQNLLLVWGFLEDWDLVQEGEKWCLVVKDAADKIDAMMGAADKGKAQWLQQEQQQDQQPPLWGELQDGAAAATVEQAAGAATAAAALEQPHGLLDLLPPAPGPSVAAAAGRARPAALFPANSAAAAAAAGGTLAGAPSVAVSTSAAAEWEQYGDEEDEYAGIASFTAADRKKLQVGLELIRLRLQRAKRCGKGTQGAQGQQEAVQEEVPVGDPPAHLVERLRQNVLRSMKGKPLSVNINKVGDPRQIFPPELVPFRKVRLGRVRLWG
jgi:hypothetical protein